ncbi:matrixin family metalloprotease [Levilactobacillus parabrevis]|nr:matrixin family metalloprotease [Levilactobacillus parabrevis]
MKVVRRLLIVVVLVVAGFVAKTGWGPFTGMPGEVAQLQAGVTRWVSGHQQPTKRQGSGQSSVPSGQSESTVKVEQVSHKQTKQATGTPIEPIVVDQQLKRTYKYHFAKDVPAKERHAFIHAVHVYNHTGIVHLKAGRAAQSENQITFGAYHKKVARNQTSVELGRGGPQVTETVSFRGMTIRNKATASLNITYALAFKDSVAIHELGHALGLDHSTDRASVMYPLDQGKMHLSSADVRGLRQVYQQTKS